MKWPSLLILLTLAAACTKPPMLSKSRTAEEAYAECHGYTDAKSYEKANQCFELVRNRHPGTPEAAEAEIEMADNYFRQEDYLVAVESYKAFARLHPVHPKVDYIYYRTGLAYLKYSPKAIDRDQQYLSDAMHNFSLVLKVPGSQYTEVAKEKWNEARRRLAARSFYVGRFYYRTKEYLAAIPRFQDIVTNYSNLGYDEKSLYYLGRSYLKLGDKEKAGGIVGVFDQHFPESSYRKKLAGKLDHK